MYEIDWTQILWRWADRELPHKLESGVERILWDGSRVDMLLENLACEVDWSPKWAEGVGQAIWYSLVTNRRGCVILLCKSPLKERNHLYRALAICKTHDLDLWVVDCENRVLDTGTDKYDLTPFGTWS